MTTTSLARSWSALSKSGTRKHVEQSQLLTLVWPAGLLELFDWASAGKKLARLGAGQGNSFEGNPASFGCFGAMFVFDVSLHSRPFVDVFVQSSVLPVYPALSLASCHPRAASRTGTLQNTMGLPGTGPGHCQVLSSLCLGSWQWRPLCRLFQRMQPDGYLSLRT